MSRPLRVEYPGAVYHLTSRGNARQDVFLGEADRDGFLNVMARVIDRYRWLCHAYCLMGNHYHLLVETLDPTLSLGMRQLNGVYTQTFNRHHRRVGHLFQGRFKSILVEKETHLLELCRYIVLNPVRAKLVRRAMDWRWSSYRATAGLSEVPTFLTIDWVLGQFGPTRGQAQMHYHRFITQGADTSPWGALKGQIFLGSDQFVQQLPRQTGVLKEIPQVQRQINRPTLAQMFKGLSQEQAIASAYREHGYRLKEIADYLRVHYATVSRRLRNWERSEGI